MSKIHLTADTRCRPISRVTSAGHRHDSLTFEPVMAGIRIRRRGRGRPRTARSGPGRQGLLQPDDPRSPAATPDEGHHPGTGQPAGQPAGPRQQRRAATTVQREDYKKRNIIERAINKLKDYRAVATRHDKRDYTFRRTIDVASIKIWLRDPVP